MNLSRRDLGLLLPSLMAAASGSSSPSKRLPSQAYSFQSLSVERQGKNEFRPVLEGTTHTGFLIELHETTLAPGEEPHAPHHHPHEEIFLIRAGEVEVTIAGRSSRLGPGGVAYVASNSEHGIRNPGQHLAQYFVLALGTD